MAKYLPKAERMFQQKLKNALTPTCYIYALGEALEYECNIENLDFYEDEIVIHEWSDCFDFNYISELFRQYGAYLLLIEDDNDVSAQTDAGSS